MSLFICSTSFDPPGMGGPSDSDALPSVVLSSSRHASPITLTNYRYLCENIMQCKLVVGC